MKKIWLLAGVPQSSPSLGSEILTYFLKIVLGNTLGQSFYLIYFGTECYNN